jgi:translation initiation factor eIF-2B subunit epsilon
LIEYTLEFLAMNGVQEVFIYCGAHTEQVETYINESARWSPTSKITPFSSLEFIRVSDARSIGDFLRDLDKRGLIGGDFFLVHGDLVANLSLDGVLAKHRARREANRDAIMTVVLREAGEDDHRTKAHGITPVFVVEPSTGRCLHYEETSPLQSDRYLTLDPTLLEQRAFDMRSDLIDCGIDICTPDVLALWSESFDYELPRKNFLHGVLKDWELNGKLIHAEIVDQGYAARASNLQMYDAISRDVLGRWTYPLVPDSNLVAGHSYKLLKHGACLEDGVTIAPKASVSKSVVGKRTSFGVGTTVSNSIIGRRCKIGKNVRIENSFLWDDVVVDDGTTITHAILADSVVVGKEASVPPGSLLSFGVHLGSRVQLPSDRPQLICLVSADEQTLNTDHGLVGSDGKGARYSEAADEEEGDADEEDASALQKNLIYSLEGVNISVSSISSLGSHESEDSDDEGGSQGTSLQHGDSEYHRSRLSSFASDDSATKSGAFHSDAVHGLLDALRADDTSDFDSAKLEFMGLRLANDASDHAMRRAVAVAFARRAAELVLESGLEPAKAADKALNAKRGATKFIREVGVGGGETEQAEFALALQKGLLGVAALGPPKAGTLLSAMLQQLYSQDAMEEEGIMAWWADKRSAEGESMGAARERCRVLVEWLENADDDDDSEEEDDD